MSIQVNTDTKYDLVRTMNVGEAWMGLRRADAGVAVLRFLLSWRQRDGTFGEAISYGADDAGQDFHYNDSSLDCIVIFKNNEWHNFDCLQPKAFLCETSKI